MIIGISGKKQHGKDTVANIIQYLAQQSDACFSDYGEYLSWKNNPRDYPESIFFWQKKQFAGKLKEMVCMLIGCTMGQLEDNTFKETPLGEEWRYWFASYYKLKTDRNPQGKITGIYSTRQELVEFLKVDMMVQAFNNVHQIESAIHTPRTLLQFLGTDCGRNIIHPNIWINATMADYKLERYEPSIADKIMRTENLGYPNWIITDVRFPNELQAVKDKGGIIIRVNREGAMSHDLHASETALDDYQNFDAVIENNSDLNHLVENVKQILIKFKIIE